MIDQIQQLSRSGKTQNLASGVDVGKYRSPRVPSIAPTADINNHKEISPTWGLANVFFTRKEINSEEMDPPTGEEDSAMEAVTAPNKKIYHSNNIGGSAPKGGISSMSSATAMKRINRKEIRWR